jgi:choline dehydrogenase-like flavoprotein
MPTSGSSQVTDFTRDVLGRFVCNGFDEAKRNADKTASRPDGSPQNDARPFDVIVIGAGSFGSAFAQHLFYADETRSHRILLLDSGSLVLGEHVQNIGLMRFDPPPPVEQDPFVARNEVWGLPWRSNIGGGFPGLAYVLGGRSVYFGGWSPRLLDEEMPSPPWPASVKADLAASDFGEAAAQIGTDTPNDFIFGPMHEALRQQLFDGITAGQVSSAIPLDQLPLHLPEFANAPATAQNLSKLEAPLAVQSRSESGIFPINKFSSVPLLVKSSRVASIESEQGMPYPDDVKKRFMVVPHCRVVRIITETSGGVTRASGVEVQWQAGYGSPQGPQTTREILPVPAGGKIVVALGTIESTRLALLSFKALPGYDRIGKGFMVHLRSNLTIRVPRSALRHLPPAIQALQASALFVKGRLDHGDGTSSFFHHQITASGLDRPSTDSEAELFKKIPDIDTYDWMRRAHDDRVVITIRGIGETLSQNANAAIELIPELDEVSVERAFVKFTPTARDTALWNAMDKSADDVAKVFADGQDFEVLLSDDRTFQKVSAGTDLGTILPYRPKRQGGRRDGLGTTHHEAGGLVMGDDANTSVTDANLRFHQVSNAYVAGPAVFPTVGSPNPMLTGVALARRMGRQIVARRQSADPGFTLLFDGVLNDKWRMSTIRDQSASPGQFLHTGGALESRSGSDLGLFWHADPAPNDFVLKLEWLRWRDDDNSGVFVRFPDPNSKNYNNTAYVAVHFGFEVQIDQLARPDGASIRKTAAIYGFASPTNPDNLPVRAPGEWNEFEIRVQSQDYSVHLNGQPVTQYHNTDPNRGSDAQTFIGLQTHTGRVAFRRIQIKAL